MQRAFQVWTNSLKSMLSSLRIVPDKTAWTKPRVWIFHTASSANPWKSAKIPNAVLSQAQVWKAKRRRGGFGAPRESLRIAQPRGRGTPQAPDELLNTFSALILGYEHVPDAIRSIQGALESFSPDMLPGRIPVSGLNFNPTLRVTAMGEAGFQTDLIKNIDAIVEEGLRKGPIQAARSF